MSGSTSTARYQCPKYSITGTVLLNRYCISNEPGIVLLLTLSGTVLLMNQVLPGTALLLYQVVSFYCSIYCPLSLSSAVLLLYQVLLLSQVILLLNFFFIGYNMLADFAEEYGVLVPLDSGLEAGLGAAVSAHLADQVLARKLLLGKPVSS